MTYSLTMIHRENAEFDAGNPRLIFWTAGWDSTYQILRSAICNEEWIQPLYLIDLKRPSAIKEIETMHRLRKHLRKRMKIPERLMRTRIYVADELTIDTEIAAAFHELQGKTRIGIQYRFLAQFCKDSGLKNESVDLCMTRHMAESDLQRVILKGVGSSDYQLNGFAANTLFKYYRFPTIEFTKEDMRNNAEKQGFLDLMQETWFCHKPINKLPCGFCNPCKIARRERSGIIFSRFGRPVWLYKAVRNRILAFFAGPSKDA